MCEKDPNKGNREKRSRCLRQENIPERKKKIGTFKDFINQKLAG